MADSIKCKNCPFLVKFTLKSYFFLEHVRSRRYLNMVAISDRNDAGFCLNTVEIEFIDEDDLPLANVFEHRV